MTAQHTRTNKIMAALAAATMFSVFLSSCTQESPNTETVHEAKPPVEEPATDGGQASAQQDGAETQEENVQSKPYSGGNILEQELSGQEAIDALGDNIETVASRIGKSSGELKELLLRDPSAHVTRNGFVVYRDAFPKSQN